MVFSKWEIEQEREMAKGKLVTRLRETHSPEHRSATTSHEISFLPVADGNQRRVQETRKERKAEVYKHLQDPEDFVL